MVKQKLIILFALLTVLLCCVSVVSAASNDTVDNVVCEIDSNDEFISVSNCELVDDMDESVLSAQEEYGNLSVNDDEQVYSSNEKEDVLTVTNQETNVYLDDIKVSASDEFYNFVDYLIKQKGFKFNTKANDDGYTIYSSSNYQCILYGGENYVLPAGTQYFISKNRAGYVIDNEYYPDILYSQNDNIYVDELYLGWLKNIENYHFTLTIEGTDSTVTVSGASSDGVNTIVNGVPLVNGSTQGDSSNLPSSYDLRNVIGQNYVSPVKNQGEDYSNCWAFASLAALESYLLKTDGKSYNFSSSYDFSENNMKNVISSIGKQGADLLVNEGGVDNMVLAYLLRWSGPILEEFDKYDIANMNNVPLEFDNAAKHVQGVKYINARNNATDNDEIKQTIYDYGAVVTSMYWVKSNRYENNCSYYYYETTTGNMWHEVCIVGWNDDYPKENFSKQAPGNGAFLIKNSYGDDIGEEGYFWISYYDTTLARRTSTELCNKYAGFSFTLVENNTNYGKNYNYNPLGVTFWSSFNVNHDSNDCNSYYSQWVAEDDETLKACGIYTHDACDSIIKVFVDDNIVDKATTIKTLNCAGFHTITFNNTVNVKKGQKFRIEVTIQSNTPIILPIELSWFDLNEKNNERYSHANANFGESGLISNNGYSKVDITQWRTSCNLALHVYTEYKEIVVSKMDIISASYHDGFFEVQTKLLDSKNNLVKNFEVIYSADIAGDVKEYQFVKTNDAGEVTFKLSNGVKIINNQLTVSFTCYDACAAPIIKKTVNINIPSIIEGNIESISIGSRVSVGSINIKGSVNSISIETRANVKSIVIGKNLGVISISNRGVVESISLGGNIQSISTGSYASIGVISVGTQGSINSISIGSYTNIKSIVVLGSGKINSISTNNYAKIESISITNKGRIGSIYIG